MCDVLPWKHASKAVVGRYETPSSIKYTSVFNLLRTLIGLSADVEHLSLQICCVDQHSGANAKP